MRRKSDVCTGKGADMTTSKRTNASNVGVGIGMVV